MGQVALDIADYFGELRIAQFDRPEKIRPVIRRWRSRWADKPRTADTDAQITELLKVSTLNNKVCNAGLCAQIYTQEIAVLMRTVAELTHIEFVLDIDDAAEHQLKVKNYIEAFFADSRRDPEAELKKAQIPQGVVHTSSGKTLDKLMSEQAGGVEGRAPAI